MTSVEDRYYNINRVLMEMIGLWPDQNPNSAIVRTIILTIFFLSAIFVQLAVFITHEFTLEIAINVLSFVFPSFFMLLMYYIYYLNPDAVRVIIAHIYYDWKCVKSKAELDIMDEYANISKLLTKVFLFFAFMGVFVAVMSHLIPIALDIISPLNKTRAQNVHIIVEYFVDPEKYCYFFILHLTSFLCLGILTLLATGSMFFCYGFHACAMFKVTNYLMKITIDKDVLEIPNPQKERIIHGRIAYAVEIHQRAIMFESTQMCDLLVESYEKSFLLVIAIGVASLSIGLFRLLKALTAYKDIVDVSIPVILVFTHFCYLFIGNHVGQLVTNNNAEIFNTVYNLPWYIVPLSTRKLLLFLLLKGTKDIYLSAGNVFDASYEGFTMLTTSSISYFTVIYSLQ